MVEPADITPILALAFLFIVGLGLGASTTFDDFRQALQKPKAVGVGFVSQYLFMPIASYLLSLAFNVRTEVALGAVLIGCSPGGTTSNLFTYWSKGNVALSVTMSFLSTCAAFAMMPFWIWVLVEQALDSTAKIDWTNLIVSLLLIIIPTCIGLVIRKYNTTTKICNKFIWKWIETFASIFGLLFLIASIVLAILSYGNIFEESGYELWIMGSILQPLGCAFGYLVSSKVLGFSGTDTRTISLETGIQNFSLSIAILQLSFSSDDEDDDDNLKYALIFPVCYGFLYLFWSPVIVLFFRYYLVPKDEDINDEDRKDEDDAVVIGADKEGKEEEEVANV